MGCVRAGRLTSLPDRGGLACLRLVWVPAVNKSLVVFIDLLSSVRMARGCSLMAFVLTGMAGLLLSACSSGSNPYHVKDVPPRAVVRNGVAVTLGDQKLAVFRDGKVVRKYDVSTSKFGMGSSHGSNRTPLGVHAVSSKTGEGQPQGMVFKSCRPTGEVVAVDAAGRDPIVTRVIQLAGLEASNGSSHSRRIYIHGTPEERKIGTPASYGCIRMRSRDIVDLYRLVQRGTPVAIESCTLGTYLKAGENEAMRSILIPDKVVAQLPKDTGYRVSGKRYSKRRSYNRRSSYSRRRYRSASR